MIRSLLILLPYSTLAMSGEPAATFLTVTEHGDFNETISGRHSELPGLLPAYDPPQVLWHYSQTAGLTQKSASIGLAGAHVLTGGWYGGARMFQGIQGDGEVLWSHEPEGAWASLGTGTAAAETADIYYVIQTWDTADRGSNTAVHRFSGDSSIPVWSWDGSGTFDAGMVDEPGRFACSEDGSMLAVGGAMGGHLAIHFFSGGSPEPSATYQDPSLNYYPRQLRLTADGSRCIFRTAATLYRVNTATGQLEASMPLDASNDCFGVSPDGSVVAYGFTAARIAVWDGSQYNLTAGMAVPGYYGGAAAVAADNATVYFGFYRNDYRTNRIIRYDLSAPAPVWTYDYPVGTGSFQDVVEWMDCSTDGRWLVVGSWGCEYGGGDEVMVFDDLSPEAPVFSVSAPGSIFHVDMTADGRYVSAAGKHVHANQMGSGTDVYFAELDLMGTEGAESSAGLSLLLSPNPSRGAFNAHFTLPGPGNAELEIFDLSGRVLHRRTMEEGSGTGSISTDPGLEPGVYLCRLTAGGEQVSSRLVVIR